MLVMELFSSPVIQAHIKLEKHFLSEGQTTRRRDMEGSTGLYVSLLQSRLCSPVR